MNFSLSTIILLIFIPLTIYSQTEDKYISINQDKYDLSTLTIPELYRLKEVIYAHHNYSFANDNSRIYFSQFNWYTPTQRNSLIQLTKSEEINIEKINNQIESILDKSTHIPQHLNPIAEEEISDNIPAQVRANIGLFSYHIKYVFRYEDRQGQHFLVLGESPYNHFSRTQDRAVFNNVVKAVCCKDENGFLLKHTEVEDLINLKNSLFDIRFMPQYIYTDDIDNDGLADPIITYTTMGANGYLSGRTKINLVYKKAIIAIDIQSDIKKENALFHISSDFYTLPKSIQNRLISLVEKMEKDSIYPLNKNWRQAFRFQIK